MTIRALSTFFLSLQQCRLKQHSSSQASVHTLTNTTDPILHVSKCVGNVLLVAQCTPVRLGMHGFAGLCLPLWLRVFVPCRGHFDSFCNKWHSVTILLQVAHPLDFIYRLCWLQGRDTLQIVLWLSACWVQYTFAIKQQRFLMAVVFYAWSSSLEFTSLEITIFRQLNEIAKISLSMWHLLIFQTEKYCKVDLLDQHVKLG